jgi:hypothetical protein
MEAKNTDLMRETVDKYLSGEISFTQAMDIMYPLYLSAVIEIDKKINYERPEQRN